MDVVFYQVSSFSDFLPKLIVKSYEKYGSVCTFIKDEGLLNLLDDLLWTQFPFVPHATSLDDLFDPKDQPMLLSTGQIKNSADTMINVAGCLDVLSGNHVIECFTHDQKDLLEARSKLYHDFTYWQQDGANWKQITPSKKAASS